MSKGVDESTVMRPYYRARTSAALASALSGVRRAGGLTQDDLAHAISSSRPTVSRMERGAAVSTETVLAALAACGYEVILVPRGAKVSLLP